ncbi:MAG: fibronectin type III domain-containing protein [Verrucomicrobiaceae bacterium]|nr:fibronectin type III domain-containing protein [Verrucomicrobiaceae bacterium]
MASNRLPDQRDRLFALAEDMIDGLTAHEATIGIKQNTGTVLRPALTAARSAETTFGECQVLKKAANAALTSADASGKIFLNNARKRLSKFFGESASTEWAAAGWPPGTTAAPATQDQRFDLIASLRAYFTTHPEHASADMEVTAALADAAHIAISNARAALGQKITENGQAKATRDSTERNLRIRMSGLITELATLLSDEDPRWHAFGLNRPADAETPESPSFTTAVPGPNHSLLVDWDDSLRADRWRVWIKVIGVDADFRAVQTVTESDATIPGLTAGATVEVRVTSVNEAGESSPGPVASAVVG